MGEMQLDKAQKRYPSSLAMLQALPAAALGTYVFGLLATNVHLGKFGIFDTDLIDSRYVTVGILYFFFLAIWYCFAGQHLLRVELEEPAPEENEGFVRSLRKWTRFVFLTCVSTALFALIFLECAEAVLFCMLALALRIIGPRWENLWESKNLFSRFPRCDWAIEPAMMGIAIAVFFLTIGVGSLAMILFFHFLAISIYGAFAFRVARQYQKYGKEHGSISRVIMHVGAFFILSSMSFGWLQYGHIASSLGGGQIQTVELVVLDASVSKSLESLGFDVDPSFKAELIHISETKGFFFVGNKIVQLPRDVLEGVQILNAGSSGWGVYAEKVLEEVRATWE